MSKDLYSDLKIPAFLRRKGQRRRIEDIVIEPPKPIKLQFTKKEKPAEPAPTVNVQERALAKAFQLYQFLDDMEEREVWLGDSFTLQSNTFYSYLVQNEISPKVVSLTRNLCLERLAQYTDYPEDYDPDKIDDFKQFFEYHVKVCERYLSNVSKMRVRKPRKKKYISVDKKLGSFKYLKLYDQFQLGSVNPTKLIGAEQVWLYNTKYMYLTILNARNRSGLDIKGQTILNIDHDTSFTKVLRKKKAQEIIESILKASKPQCRKIFENISSRKTMLQQRSNSATIIIRIF